MKFIGGGETHMLRLADHFNQAGHRTIFASRKNSLLLEMAEKAGIRTAPLWLSGDLNPFLIAGIARIFKQEKIDAVIANNRRDVRVSGLVSKLLNGPPVIALHQIDRAIKNKWNYRLTYNFFASEVVVNSAATKKTLQIHNPWLNQEKIHVVLHGIDPSIYRKTTKETAKKLLGIPQGAFVVGFIGRLCKQKGIIYLLAAIERIAKDHGDVVFVIAGTGPLDEMLHQFLAEKSLTSVVKILGFRQDIPDIVNAFDVMLMPSLWEGFGLVLIEAMSAGVPCIATRVSSIPEIVEDRVNGLLVPPEDALAIAKAFSELRNDPDLLETLSANSIKTVDTKFSFESMVEGYEKIINKLKD